MNEYFPVPAESQLVPYEKKRGKSLFPLLAIIAFGIGLFFAAKFGVFAAVKGLFAEKPSEAPSIYEFDRTRLSAGASAILPVDLSAKKAGIAFSEPLPFSIEGIPPLSFGANGKRTVLIINTHPFEGYSPEGAYEYTDATALVGGERTVRLCAEALMQTLNDKGIPAFYVENPADSLRGSYKNAGALLTEALTAHPDTALIIDLHRAVLLAENGDLYRPVTLVDGKTAAQMRLIVATGDSDEADLRARLSAAITVSRVINAKCSSLLMPTYLSPSRLNQDLPVPYITAEIGSCGNDAAESARTASLFGEVLALLLGA